MEISKFSKNIKDFECCPHCGGTEGYTRKCYASGWMVDVLEFNSDEVLGASQDGLQYSRHSKYYCCYSCEKRIAKIEDENK